MMQPSSDTLLEHATEAVVVFDRDWQLRYLNAAGERLLEASRGDLLGRRLWDHLPGLASTPFHDLHLRAQEGKQPVFGTCPVGSRQVQLHIYPAEDHVVTYARDVSDWKAAEAAWMADLSQRDHFIRMIDYQIRHPLAVISNCAELLVLKQGESELCRRTGQRLRRTVQNLRDGLAEAFDALWVAAGQVSLACDWVELGALLGEVTETVAQEVAREPGMESDGRGLELQVERPDQPLQIWGDARRLGEVFRTLLLFAWGSRSGKVQVELGRGDKEAILEVQHPNPQLQLEPLRQTLAAPVDLFSCPKEFSSRALGVAARLVRIHGGTITVEDRAVGPGVRVILRIPLDPGERRPPASERTSTLRILMVVSDPGLGETMDDLLQLWGHTVRWAASATEALEAAPVFRPQVILVDLTPGDPQFGDLDSRLRRALDLDELPCIALSRSAETDTRGHTETLGCVRVLSRPVDPDELHECLKELARSY
ncbi:MAG TPA: PAS domain-containing protein [Armatimonadota bacterium]|nr:PAS domain-containing protein [Armatimonadota bacterium]